MIEWGKGKNLSFEIGNLSFVVTKRLNLIVIEQRRSVVYTKQKIVLYFSKFKKLKQFFLFYFLYSFHFLRH